jgi:hypothetical protein
MHLYLFLGNAHNILHSVLSIFNVGNMLKCVTSKNLFFLLLLACSKPSRSEQENNNIINLKR